MNCTAARPQTVFPIAAPPASSDPGLQHFILSINESRTETTDRISNHAERTGLSRQGYEARSFGTVSRAGGTAPDERIEHGAVPQEHQKTGSVLSSQIPRKRINLHSALLEMRKRRYLSPTLSRCGHHDAEFLAANFALRQGDRAERC
jgi:hypothetical protein